MIDSYTAEHFGNYGSGNYGALKPASTKQQVVGNSANGELTRDSSPETRNPSDFSRHLVPKRTSKTAVLVSMRKILEKQETQLRSLNASHSRAMTLIKDLQIFPEINAQSVASANKKSFLQIPRTECEAGANGGAKSSNTMVTEDSETGSDRSLETVKTPRPKNAAETDSSPDALHASESSSDSDRHCSLHQPVQLAAIWKKKHDKGKCKYSVATVQSAMEMSQSFSHGAASSCQSNALLEEEEDSWTSSFVIPPASAFRGVWDFISLILVLQECVNIPLELLNPGESLIILFFNWFGRIFWTLDIIMGFFTGYLKSDGGLERRLKSIAKRYAKTWLIFDCLIVSMDWLELIIGHQTTAAGFTRMGKASRFFRILRMGRLMRLLRLARIVAAVFERLPSESFTIIGEIIISTVCMVLVGHFIACGWYGLGVGPSRHGYPTWVYVIDLDEKSLQIRYAVSLHWAISQFTGGMDEFVPVNVNERIYAIIVFLVAFVFASCFVSVITSGLTELHRIAQSRSQSLSLLRKFLIRNCVPQEVTIRVQRNAQYALTVRERFMSEQSVEVFQFISDSLKAEVHFAIFSAGLSKHEFFKWYILCCRGVMQKVCHFGMRFMYVSKSDDIFNPFEKPTANVMYSIFDGQLQYNMNENKEVRLKKDECIMEHCLWTADWIHRGKLFASTDVRLALLDASTFQRIAAREADPAQADFDVTGYAVAYVKEMNHQAAEMELTDLNVVPQNWVDRQSQKASVRKRSTMKGLRGSMATIRGSTFNFTSKIAPNSEE